MNGMRKLYSARNGGTTKLAVKDVSLAVEKGIVFGLLGKNHENTMESFPNL